MRFLLFILYVATAVCVAQTLSVQNYSTSGHPIEAVETSDGQFVLVTVNQTHGLERYSGIDIFRKTSSGLNRVAFQRLGSVPAQGIIVIPNTRTVAIGLSDAGVAFLSLNEALVGTAEVRILSQGRHPGSGYLATTPDGRFLFVANEYGNGGNLGVITLGKNASGEIVPQMLTQIATPKTTPGITITPDGKYVFAVGESFPTERTIELPGKDVPELRHQGCVQGNPGKKESNGVLYMIDLDKIKGYYNGTPSRVPIDVTPATINAGCSPVRSTVSTNGSTVYVAARGDNRILVFDIKKLKSDPDHALLRSFFCGGRSPVGIRLFDQDTKLLVANSNRFSTEAGNISLFDLSDPTSPKLKRTLEVGSFPRNIAGSTDGKTLFLTVFGENKLLVVQAP